MKNPLKRGVYPTMITPYKEDNTVDYTAAEKLVNYYVSRGCHGVFAVCQSSEMFYLSLEERVKLARCVVRAAEGKLDVVASGHISGDPEAQIEEIRRMAETGVKAVVMVPNRLAREDESDDVLIERMDRILEAVPGIDFGMYECPYPYKRLLSEKVLKAMAESGRFSFIKDTCCDADLIRKRVELLDGKLQLFNANAATILDTLRDGADGFSGIMANFHPELYVWLFENYEKEPEKAEKLQAFLTLASGVERGAYPVSAKYYMQKIGIPMTLVSRTRPISDLSPLLKREVDDLITLQKHFLEFIQA